MENLDSSRPEGGDIQLIHLSIPIYGENVNGRASSRRHFSASKRKRNGGSVEALAFMYVM
jgi:hypothetical protein